MDQYDIEQEEFENECHEFLMERGFICKNKNKSSICKFYCKDNFSCEIVEMVYVYPGSENWTYTTSLPSIFGNRSYGKGINDLIFYISYNSIHDKFVKAAQEMRWLIDLWDYCQHGGQV